MSNGVVLRLSSVLNVPPVSAVPIVKIILPIPAHYETAVGSKTGRTTLVQCSLRAIKRNDDLKKYYERVKARCGPGKAKIALARKYLKIIYHPDK